MIVRLSDFKTNEYANLVGGKLFEPHEENPMIGWRGASRYYDPKYRLHHTDHSNHIEILSVDCPREGFALECKALVKVREEMGLKNVIVMVPFCRTPNEVRNLGIRFRVNEYR